MPHEGTHIFQHTPEALDPSVVRPYLVLLKAVLTDTPQGVICSFYGMLLILMSRLNCCTDNAS